MPPINPPTTAISPDKNPDPVASAMDRVVLGDPFADVAVKLTDGDDSWK